MKNFWYPLTLSEDLPQGACKPVQLFGEPLVLFRGESGEPICLIDRCPHRSIPLSLGRVEQGRIECRYHGWQFGARGQCLRIPSQKAEVRIPPRACAQHRACAERHGMVWVWAGAADATEAAGASGDAIDGAYGPALAPLGDEGMYAHTYDARIDVPHELAIENLLDPAHLPFTHHGTMSRRSFAQPIRFDDLDDGHAVISAQSVIEPPQGAPVPPIERVVFRFYEPCIAVLDLFGKPKGKFQMRSYQVHFCVPVAKDASHMFSFYGANFMRPFKRLLKPIFRRLAAKALDQDFEVLRAQKIAMGRGAPPFDQAVAADRLALRYRKWLADNLLDSLWFDGFVDASHPSLKIASARAEDVG
ncbi:MAG: Rieske 2Fe-2S domain-containing protein [Myxococcales bacterium]|nr:Rieske 2Fe-2S domain-containing protein [Myxococcales bacterium]